MCSIQNLSNNQVAEEHYSEELFTESEKEKWKDLFVICSPSRIRDAGHLKSSGEWQSTPDLLKLYSVGQISLLSSLVEDLGFFRTLSFKQNWKLFLPWGQSRNWAISSGCILITEWIRPSWGTVDTEGTVLDYVPDPAPFIPIFTRRRWGWWQCLLETRKAHNEFITL